MDIEKISKEINENAHDKGFWDKGLNIPEKLLLCISELTEAMEADRKDRSSYNRGLYVSPESDTFITDFEDSIKDTFEDELADAAIRIFDLAYEMQIPLSLHIELKHEYNKTREIMHGGKKY